jgi:hypothetical protein
MCVGSFCEAPPPDMSMMTSSDMTLMPSDMGVSVGGDMFIKRIGPPRQ